MSRARSARLASRSSRGASLPELFPWFAVAATAAAQADSTATPSPDHTVSGDRNELAARDAFGALSFAIENGPLAANPKSSETTALGRVRLIENRIARRVR